MCLHSKDVSNAFPFAHWMKTDFVDKIKNKTHAHTHKHFFFRLTSMWSVIIIYCFVHEIYSIYFDWSSSVRSNNRHFWLILALQNSKQMWVIYVLFYQSNLTMFIAYLPIHTLRYALVNDLFCFFLSPAPMSSFYFDWMYRITNGKKVKRKKHPNKLRCFFFLCFASDSTQPTFVYSNSNAMLTSIQRLRFIQTYWSIHILMSSPLTRSNGVAIIFVFLLLLLLVVVFYLVLSLQFSCDKFNKRNPSQSTLSLCFIRILWFVCCDTDAVLQALAHTWDERRVWRGQLSAIYSRVCLLLVYCVVSIVIRTVYDDRFVAKTDLHAFIREGLWSLSNHRKMMQNI